MMTSFLAGAALGVALFLLYHVRILYREIRTLRDDLEKLSLDFVDHDIRQLQFCVAKGWIPVQVQEDPE